MAEISNCYPILGLGDARLSWAHRCLQCPSSLSSVDANYFVFSTRTQDNKSQIGGGLLQSEGRGDVRVRVRVGTEPLLTPGDIGNGSVGVMNGSLVASGKSEILLLFSSFELNDGKFTSGIWTVHLETSEHGLQLRHPVQEQTQIRDFAMEELEFNFLTTPTLDLDNALLWVTGGKASASFPLRYTIVGIPVTVGAEGIFPDSSRDVILPKLDTTFATKPSIRRTSSGTEVIYSGRDTDDSYRIYSFVYAPETGPRNFRYYSVADLRDGISRGQAYPEWFRGSGCTAVMFSGDNFGAGGIWIGKI